MFANVLILLSDRLAAFTLSATLSAALVAIAPAAAQPPATFVPRQESPEDFPAGAGREETFYACTACHNFKLVAAQGMTREQWDETLDWMTQKHKMPELTGAERKRVLDYLEATFPPRGPATQRGWQNPFLREPQ